MESLLAFYRNSVVHAFLETSIVQLALAFAVRQESDPLAAFWAQAMRLRDLLKFDFYFADSAAFRDHVAHEMSWHGDWESSLSAGGEPIETLLRAKRPLTAAAALRPFFEADLIFVDALRDSPAGVDESGADEESTRDRSPVCRQKRVRSEEAVSTLLFATPRQVAADQTLLEPAANLIDQRLAFRSEVRGILRDIDFVEQAAVDRFVGRDETSRSMARRDD